jgi:hypothetical protein
MGELPVERSLSSPTPVPVAALRNDDEKGLVLQGEEAVEWEMYAAALMALHRQPMTEEATSLSTEVADRILDWERSQKKRANERRGTLGKFRNAVGRVVADLVSVTEERPRRWLYRPLAREEFTDEPVSYRDFDAILDAMRALALIEVKPGYFSRGEDGPHGSCTRLRCSLQLLELLGQHGIEMKEARRHFRWLLPTKPLVLRASSSRQGSRRIRGRRMKIVPTERSQELAAEVREINDFIQQHTLEGGTHHGYRRVFNCGDAESFAWNKGGRLYGQGENYQQLKKDQRLRMLIDGEPVAEIDVRASYLTILQALRRAPLYPFRDPYDVPGLPRDVVKAWVTMTLGHHGFHRRWPKDIADDYLKGHGERLCTAHPVREVQRAVLTALPVLADWPEQTLTCFDLMFLESEAIVRTMLRLKREHGAVCLSVHDSIIVPAAQETTGARVLREEYRRIVGVEPALKVNRPDGSVEVVSASARVGRLDATEPACEGELESLEWPAILAGTTSPRRGMSPVLRGPNGA